MVNNDVSYAVSLSSSIISSNCNRMLTDSFKDIIQPKGPHIAKDFKVHKQNIENDHYSHGIKTIFLRMFVKDN
jgi:hypothetical protein